ncbi:Clip domain-containing protein [Caenorhabditis elegans]|uniref:Clip domain-containing protein n=1 Tax=Caenorhabditis elegans TaxID=6239 RepID=Q9XUQ0_CAEEL|nr:Clip domain-containing protein [Caenorhabditis elegans]CAB04725.1 Clip domain-containing protein [Caenorhabditis elegans]|eukprot:NP_506231.1 Prion-like-(Q/N-rich)-domain-bearing protein [Caenorhabditis elegans]
MQRIFLCWLAIATVSQTVSAKKFMKIFADAGIGIHCPSGNKVYIHPISGDLQLCTQQLGVYNETSCPGGTACERFPILIPGFQDYCCWSESNPESELSSELEIVKPPMSKRKPGVTVAPIDEEDNEKIFPIDEEEEEDLKIEEKKSVRKLSSDEDEEEEIEWEFETTTVKPRKTKSRKVPIITTTEPPMLITTTIKSAPSRRPQCNDPDKTVLIDYGNRLRDCYFTQCLRGFKCEFNREIRRFICCGNEIDVPPAGLPRIPEPSPVIKSRPFRPNRPFGRLNDGEEDEGNTDGENRGPRNPIVPFNQAGPFQGPIVSPKVESMIENSLGSTSMPNPNRKSKYDEDDDYEDGDGNGCNGNGCSYGRRGGGNQNSGGGCEMNCRRNGGGNNDGCGCNRRGGNNNGNRGGNSQECGNGGCPWNGNNNNNNNNGNRPRRPRPDTDYEENENGCEADLGGSNGGGNGPVPPIPEPKPLCKGLKFKKTANGGGGNNNNNNNNNNRNNGPPPRNNGNNNGNGRPMKPPSSSGSGSNRRSGPPPPPPPPRSSGANGNRNGGGGNRRNNNKNSSNSNNNNNFNGNGNGDGSYNNNNDNCDFENRCGGQGGFENGNENQRFSSRKQPPPKPSANNNNGDRKLPRSVPYIPPQSPPTFNDCPKGAEYLDGFNAPKCLPPAIDSCPMSHNKCRYSSRFGHHLCCNSQ